MSIDLIPVGALLSLICSGALLTTWCLIPRWRTLLNYVSINQIITGTLHLVATSLSEYNINDKINDALILINGYLFLGSLCWSLCTSMISYLKLVLVYPGKISQEKRKATIFSYVVLFTIKLVTDCFVPNAFGVSKFSSLVAVRFVPLYVINSMNMFVFIKVVLTVMSCRKSRMSKMRGGHVVSLIGVGFVCDVVITICMLMVLIDICRNNYDIIIWMNVIALRLIPQTMVVLFNKKSRDIWRKHLRRRRYNRSNIIQM